MKRLVRFICLLAALSLLFCFSFSPVASYNDAEFDRYVNMGDNAVKNGHAIPTLFRQNGVYKYYDRYPLIVQDGLEYVSLSMFILYSHIEVNYSNTSEDFFLVNHRNNRYISFNVEQGLASTYDGDLLRIAPRIFNQTIYIPARTVAVVLGLSCETYNDREKGIYAFRIYDGDMSTPLRELVRPYIDEYFKVEEETPEVKPEPEKPDVPKVENPNGETNPPTVKPEPENPDTPPVTPKPEDPGDPLEKLAQRRVGLCYRGISNENMSSLLAVIGSYRIKAAFAAEYEEILGNPALLRRLYVSGHTVALSANGTEGSSPKEYAENFVKELDRANDALWAVLKKKTRLCVLPANIPEEYKTDGDFLNTVKNSGYAVFVPNTETGDSPSYSVSAYAVSGRIKNKITGGFDEKTPADITAELWCSDKTRYSTADVALLVNKYRQFGFFAIDEAFVYNS